MDWRISNISRRILRFIRYPYGHRTEKRDPNKALEILERWSGWATLTILAGIVAEIMVIWWFPAGLWEKIGASAANALIGIGLIIEYIVIGRTIVASGEAKRESDERVAAAEARAAEATRDAEKIRLELAKFRERRILRHEHWGLVDKRISRFRPKFDIGISDSHDDEQHDFLWALDTLLSALWVRQPWSGGPTVPISPHGSVGQVRASNVSIRMHRESETHLRPSAEALAAALNELGIAAAVEPFGATLHNANIDAIHVLIGPKR